jgi:hypothetical protein
MCYWLQAISKKLYPLESVGSAPELISICDYSQQCKNDISHHLVCGKIYKKIMTAYDKKILEITVTQNVIRIMDDHNSPTQIAHNQLTVIRIQYLPASPKY